MVGCFPGRPWHRDGPVRSAVGEPELAIEGCRRRKEVGGIAGDRERRRRRTREPRLNVFDHSGPGRVADPELGAVDAVVGSEDERVPELDEKQRIGARPAPLDVEGETGVAGGRVGDPELGAEVDPPAREEDRFPGRGDPLRPEAGVGAAARPDVGDHPLWLGGGRGSRRHQERRENGANTAEEHGRSHQPTPFELPPILPGVTGTARNTICPMSSAVDHPPAGRGWRGEPRNGSEKAARLGAGIGNSRLLDYLGSHSEDR